MRRLQRYSESGAPAKRLNRVVDEVERLNRVVDEVESTYRDTVVEAYKEDIDRTLLVAHARFADELRRAGRELRSSRK
jgi:phosphoglycerate-specific signal transduction histidine kinase